MIGSDFEFVREAKGELEAHCAPTMPVLSLLDWPIVFDLNPIPFAMQVRDCRDCSVAIAAGARLRFWR